MNDFQGVADTLYIPLEARIFASEAFPEYFYDEKSLALKSSVPHDQIRKKSSEYALMASVARYYNMDAIVKAFIQEHKTCNIVYLGAGLETAYYRLKEREAVFYEVDLPEVIASRQALLGSSTNEVLVPGDLFDLAWTESIDKTQPSLLIASGVFQYFAEEKVLAFMEDVRTSFDCAQLLFDATNETGLRYANQYVRKTGNEDAQMQFYVNDGAEFAKKSECSSCGRAPFLRGRAQTACKKANAVYTHSDARSRSNAQDENFASCMEAIIFLI